MVSQGEAISSMIAVDPALFNGVSGLKMDMQLLTLSYAGTGATYVIFVIRKMFLIQNTPNKLVQSF